MSEEMSVLKNLSEDEIRALVLLYVVRRYGHNVESDNIYREEASTEEVLGSLGISYRGHIAMGDTLALGKVGGKLKRKGLVSSNRYRYESGHGAVAQFHELTTKGHELADALLEVKHKELLRSRDRYASGARRPI